MKILFSLFCLLFLFAGCAKKTTIARLEYLDDAGMGDFHNGFAKISDSLYAGIGEVTNGQYRAFLNHLLKNGDTALYTVCAVDSSEKPRKMRLCAPMYVNYWRHPAFWNDPVVSISYEGAVAYCNWITEAYNNQPDTAIGKLQFRLPTKDEWETAACGGNPKNIFPWNGED
jgi:formylglycine-generating enzyme required for sulfatase activity